MANPDEPDFDLIREAIAAALDSDDPALIRLDAPELRQALAEALTEFRQIEARLSDLLRPIEARISAIEEKLQPIAAPI